MIKPVCCRRDGRRILARAVGMCLFASVLPMTVLAQAPAPAETGTLVLAVSYRPPPSPRAPAQTDRVVIPGAIVTLASGVMIGTTNDSGYVDARDLPAGKVQLSVRATDYSPLRCQATVRAGVTDTVRVEMHREKVPAIWSSYGCKQRR
jgi:hypothetical protein